MLESGGGVIIIPGEGVVLPISVAFSGLLLCWFILSHYNLASYNRWANLVLAFMSVGICALIARNQRTIRREFNQHSKIEETFRQTCTGLQEQVDHLNESLSRREAELTDFFDNATVGLQIIDEQGVVLRANRAELRLLDYSEAEYIGQNFAQFHLNEVTAEDILKRLNRHETINNYPAKLLHKDGSTKHVLIDASVRLKDGRFVDARCFTRDVTDRARVDHHLQASRREVNDLKAALDEHAIVAITDPRGRITYVNDKFCAISKYSREELIGKDHRIINSSHHTNEFMKNLWETIRNGKVWKGEIKNRAKDGSYYWVDTTIVPFLGVDNKPFQYVAIRADITERKQAQLEVEKISERLRLATHSSGIGIWDWYLDTNTLVWDDIMYRLYGIKAGDFTKTYEAWENALHPDDFDNTRKQIQEALREEKVYDTSFRVVWPDETIHYIRAHGNVQRDSTGKAVRMTGTNWDITDHQLAEKKLAASLHEKEILLKEIHHRVKNNMQVVSSLLSLQSATISDAKALESFRESEHRVKSMALLHEKLYQSENLSSIDFADYLGSLLDYLFSSFGSNATHIRRTIDVQNVSLGLDTAIPCGLIINELASNALKYAYTGRDHGELNLKMALEEDGQYHLRIRDDGVGLPENLDWRKADSLGLQLVNMLTGQLRGTVEHQNNIGTEFHIAFQDRSHKQN